MKRRGYANYKSYLIHQRRKTADPRLRDRLRGRRAERLDAFRAEMACLSGHVPDDARALCLGARLGEEVEVLRTLGYAAIGVDLVPCPPLVVEGDFHHLQWGPAAFGLVYCNSVDHVYDLGRFAAEIDRVLEPGGWLFTVLRPEDWGQYESLRLDTVEAFTDAFPGFAVRSKVEVFRPGLLPRVRLLMQKREATE